MTVEGFGGLLVKIDKVERTLDRASTRAITEAVAFDAKKDYLRQAEADLSNRDFSNWHRGRPFQLGARYDMQADGTALVGPSPRTTGPWKVLTFGRRAYDKGGPTRKRRGKSRRGPSSGGSTRGRGTASKAKRTVEHETPGRVQRELHKRLAAIFASTR